MKKKTESMIYLFLCGDSNPGLNDDLHEILTTRPHRILFDSFKFARRRRQGSFKNNVLPPIPLPLSLSHISKKV